MTEPMVVTVQYFNRIAVAHIVLPTVPRKFRGPLVIV